MIQSVGRKQAVDTGWNAFRRSDSVGRPEPNVRDSLVHLDEVIQSVCRNEPVTNRSSRSSAFRRSDSVGQPEPNGRDGRLRFDGVIQSVGRKQPVKCIWTEWF